MGAANTMAVVGGAALAAYAIDRAGKPAGGARDAGYTSVDSTNRAESTKEAAARRSLQVPCGAPRLPYADIKLDGKVGATFAAEWASETRSLCAKFGAFELLVFSSGRPRLTADCCVAWIDMWLDCWWRLRAAEPVRWAAFGPFAQEASVHDKTELPATGNAFFGFGKVIGWTAIGLAWKRLLEVRNSALWLGRAGDTKVYTHADQVADALKGFALALDQAAGLHMTNAAEAAAEGAAGLARSAAKGAAGAVAWLAAEVLGPAAGALVSTVGPYLVVGGAIYLVARKAA